MATETKSNLNETTVKSVQDLIQMNIDSRDGFRYAAEKLQDSHAQLAANFRKFSDCRDVNATELQGLVLMNGEEPENRGSSAASLHRTWMSIRDMFASEADPVAVLAEAERGEDYIKAAYEDALKDNPGSAVSDTLNRQYRQVKELHDTVRDLRDTAKQNS